MGIGDGKEIWGRMMRNEEGGGRGKMGRREREMK